MSQSEQKEALYPDYVQTFQVPGGWWRRMGLDLLFRLTAKGRLGLDMDILKARREQEGFDARFNPEDTSTKRRDCTASDFKAQWIEAMDVRPERVILYLHGGAFIFRYPRAHARLVGDWCKALKARPASDHFIPRTAALPISKHA